jgi:hypothetical protein
MLTLSTTRRFFSILLAWAALGLIAGFNPQARAEGKWAVREFTDVSVEAPFGFNTGPDIMAQLPEAVKKLIGLYQIFDSGDNTLPRCTVARVAYKEGTPVSIDGAIAGAMRQAAGAIGDTDPKFDTKTVTVSGMPGRRASYRGKAQGQDIYIDGLVVMQGTKMWQVQALYLAPSDAASAKRILDSTKITPAK